MILSIATFDFEKCFRKLLLIHTTEIRHVFLTFMMTINSTNFTFHSLLEEPIQKRTTMITEGWTFKVILLESMRNINLESFFKILKRCKLSIIQVKRSSIFESMEIIKDKKSYNCVLGVFRRSRTLSQNFFMTFFVHSC